MEQHVEREQQSNRYLPGNIAFFRHVRSKAVESKKRISTTIASAKGYSAERINRVLRPRITIELGDWKTLHSFVKPATDAHSLTTPDPLVRLARRELRGLGGMERSDLVVLLTRELMYFQNEVTDTPLEPDDIFPAEVALVEIPYSQGTNFFSNLNVFHELGHFVFQSRYKSDQVEFVALAEEMKKGVEKHPELCSGSA